MGNSASSEEPAVRVVKIKSRAKLSKFFAILAVAAFISLGLYLFRDSAFGVLVSRAFDRIFNTNERELVEIVNLNELNSSPSSGDETKYEEIVINESGVENYVAKTVDLSGIEISNVLFDTEGGDEGNERITLINRGGSAVDLSGGSIQYFPVGSDFSKIRKKNFPDGSSIAAGGIFVVGTNCSAKNPCIGVDMTWSSALGNSGGAVFLVSSKDEISSPYDARVVYSYDYVAD